MKQSQRYYSFLPVVGVALGELVTEYVSEKVLMYSASLLPDRFLVEMGVDDRRIRTFPSLSIIKLVNTQKRYSGTHQLEHSKS